MKELVSIILPVYNAEDYLEKSVNSILCQTYECFELIIVDDGSTDTSLSILNKLADQDERVKLHTRSNKGLIFTLNEMILLARGDYIARMDADDIAHPQRIEKQVGFLSENNDVAVLGTGYDYINEADIKIGSRKVTSHSSLVRSSLLVGNPIAHPTVMFNKAKCGSELYYNDSYLHAEDFELWVRLAINNDCKLANLNSTLLDYRVHSNSVSSKHHKAQKESACRALLNTDFGGELQKKNIQVNDIYCSDVSVYNALKAIKTNIKLQTFPFFAFAFRLIVSVIKRKKVVRINE